MIFLEDPCLCSHSCRTGHAGSHLLHTNRIIHNFLPMVHTTCSGASAPARPNDRTPVDRMYAVYIYIRKSLSISPKNHIIVQKNDKRIVGGLYCMAAFFGANEIWKTHEGDSREPVILAGVRELDAKEPGSEEAFRHSLKEVNLTFMHPCSRLSMSVVTSMTSSW